MKDAKPRVLRKQIPPGGCTWTLGSAGALEDITSSNGWEFITQALNTQAAFAFRDYIDLSGYSLEDLTTFIQGIDIQHARDPIQVSSANLQISLLWRYDFFTTRRITDDELGNLAANLAVIPGYLPSTVDLMEMIYGEHRTYAVNSNVPATFITTNSDTLGSGNPSAAERLHWTQVYVFTPGGNEEDTGGLVIQAANLVSQAITGKEKDLVYMERLRRSYTQERPDNG